jgi:hypothetical protein
MKCGGTFHVQQFSPDMDIRPVALCMVCLMGMVARAEETGPGVHVMCHRETAETYTQATRAIDNVHDLIERSSLGTPEAKAARETVPEGVAAEAVRRSQEEH